MVVYPPKEYTEVVEQPEEQPEETQMTMADPEQLERIKAGTEWEWQKGEGKAAEGKAYAEAQATFKEQPTPWGRFTSSFAMPDFMKGLPAAISEFRKEHPFLEQAAGTIITVAALKGAGTALKAGALPRAAGLFGLGATSAGFTAGETVQDISQTGSRYGKTFLELLGETGKGAKEEATDIIQYVDYSGKIDYLTGQIDKLQDSISRKADEVRDRMPDIHITMPSMPTIPIKVDAGIGGFGGVSDILMPLALLGMGAGGLFAGYKKGWFDSLDFGLPSFDLPELRKVAKETPTRTSYYGYETPYLVGG